MHGTTIRKYSHSIILVIKIEVFHNNGKKYELNDSNIIKIGGALGDELYSIASYALSALNFKGLSQKDSIDLSWIKRYEIFQMLGS